MADAELQRQEDAGFVDTLEEAMPDEAPSWESLAGRCALTAYCLQLTAHCLLLTAYCLLRTAYCLLLTAYCVLLTAYCLLLTAYRKIEIRWRYYSTDDLTKDKPVFIWCWCDVLKVADGTALFKETARSKAQPQGALRIRWPPDEKYSEEEKFQWIVLRRDKWNKPVHYGWRCAPLHARTRVSSPPPSSLPLIMWLNHVA